MSVAPHHSTLDLGQKKADWQDHWDRWVRKKIIEISTPVAGGASTLATDMLLQAQGRGEPTAWIQPEAGSLYPPDLHDSGVDLNSLVVIQVPPRAGPHGALKAAEILLRSGAYGLVVIDMREKIPTACAAWQGRLLSLAREHHSVVVILTHKTAQSESIGALISWRIEPQLQVHPNALFSLRLNILKNKMGGHWPQPNCLRRGPWGLW